MPSVLNENDKRPVFRHAATALTILLAVLAVAFSAFILCGPFSSGTQTVSGLCGNLSIGGRVADFDGEIYYAAADGIYSVNTDKTATRVADGRAGWLNVEKNYLYYVLDGKLTVLKNMVSVATLAEDCTSLSVNGTWIYYTDSAGKLYKMTTAGTDIRRVGNVTVDGTFAVDSGYVYYTDSRGLVKIRTNGDTDTETVLAGDCTGYFAYYRYVIYYQAADGVYSIDADDGSGRLLRAAASLFNYGNNIFVYYADGAINVIDNSGDSESVSSVPIEVEPSALYITSDGVYYEHEDELTLVAYPEAQSDSSR